MLLNNWALFYWKNKNIINLSSAVLAQKVVKVKNKDAKFNISQQFLKLMYNFLLKIELVKIMKPVLEKKQLSCVVFQYGLEQGQVKFITDEFVAFCSVSTIAQDKAYFHVKSVHIFFYFCMKTYVVGTH